MIVGRRGEQRRLEELLDAARLGMSGSLVLRGEAGVGKTTMLAYARELAADFQVLGSQGVESESELAYAGLAELLRPILSGLDDLPAPQAQALGAACAVREVETFDRFAVYAGALTLLASASERDGPVLALIDDAQWLDAVSQEALLFISRRLKAESIVLVFAARIGEHTEFESPGLPELVLSGLEAEPATALLEQHAPAPVSPAVAARIVSETRGNPLALKEVSTLLTRHELAGEEPLSAPLRAGETVERAFRSQLARLSPEGGRAITVAAASESGRMDEVAAACAALDVRLDALEEAESVQLVAVDGERVVFRHPLLRSAAYYAAARGERRRAHQALAEALVGIDPPRRAWHLAAAAIAPDEPIAAELEQVGLETRRRGGHSAAALAFERAARCTPVPAERARRLYEAAGDAQLAGRSPHAVSLLDEALASAGDDLRTDIRFLRARIELTRGSPFEARQRLLAEASTLEDDAPDKAAVMLSIAVGTCLHEGDLEAGLAIAERAYELAKRVGGLPEIVAEGRVGVAMILLGDAEHGRPYLQRCDALLDEGDVLAGHQLALFLGQVALWLEEYERARFILGRVIGAARAESALGLLPYPLLVQSELDYRCGRWSAANAAGAESVRLAEELGHEATVMHALSCLARVEAAQGREADSAEHAGQALRLAESLGAGAHIVYARSVLGLRALGVGDHETAIAELAEVERLALRFKLGEPGVAQWAPDLVEAYVRQGQPEQAVRTLAILEEQAARTGRTWALATAARCRGLLAEDAEFEEHFLEALSWHERTPTPFERARTELCFGERLRRAKRQSESRTRLRSALETLQGLGAAPWAERTRLELRAAGGRTGRTSESARDSLTAQELQVALVVAGGATNREAAASLFLSPKTVEFHLGNTYRKLNVRSRSELTRVFARDGAPAELPALTSSR